MKTFSILCLVGLLTGCSCNILSTSKGCSAALATGMVVTAPILLPYYGTKTLVDGHKDKRTDKSLIKGVQAGERSSLELTLNDRISLKTPYNERLEMSKIAAKKLIPFDDYSTAQRSQAWNEISFRAMILAYRQEAYAQGSGSELFERYMTRAWDLYQMLKYSNLNYYQDAIEYKDIGQKYYLIKHGLLKQNADFSNALPIFNQCLEDPMWQDKDKIIKPNQGYLNCKYALAYYTKKIFPDMPLATQPALQEIERQFQQNLEESRKKS